MQKNEHIWTKIWSNNDVYSVSEPDKYTNQWTVINWQKYTLIKLTPCCVIQ